MADYRVAFGGAAADVITEKKLDYAELMREIYRHGCDARYPVTSLHPALGITADLARDHCDDYRFTYTVSPSTRT